MSVFITTLISCDFIWEQTRKRQQCSEGQLTTISCDTCTHMQAQGEMRVATLSAIKDSVINSRTDTTLLMFINSGCPDFPSTMPPFLDALAKRSTIRPILVFSDNYADAPVARSRAFAWGWRDRMYILDQEECGCYMDTRQRNAVVLEKLGIKAPSKYHLTVNLLVLLDKQGLVLDTSQYLDMDRF